jgi:hypothetical protein
MAKDCCGASASGLAVWMKSFIIFLIFRLTETRLNGIRGSGFRVQGSGFRVQGSGIRGQESGVVRQKLTPNFFPVMICKKVRAKPHTFL